MTALSANRNTTEISCNATNLTRRYVVKASNTIYAGSLVAIDATGYAVPASDASGLLVVGRAENYAEAGESVNCKSGVFLFTNSGSNALADATHLNNLCYVEDDQTVGSSGGSNNIKAGVFRGVDPSGSSAVMIEVGNLRTT